MTLPPAGTACRAIIKSGCTKGCRGQCRRCLKTCTAQCCANAVDVNYLGILGEDLGVRHHYNVIKLSDFTYFREYLSNTFKIVAPDNLYFDINVVALGYVVLKIWE